MFGVLGTPLWKANPGISRHREHLMMFYLCIKILLPYVQESATMRNWKNCAARWNLWSSTLQYLLAQFLFSLGIWMLIFASMLTSHILFSLDWDLELSPHTTMCVCSPVCFSGSKNRTGQPGLRSGDQLWKRKVWVRVMASPSDQMINCKGQSSHHPVT